MTDRQTDGIAMAYTRYSIYAVARKKVLPEAHDNTNNTNVCVYLASGGSESVYLANCVGQSGSMQVRQGFTVGVRHRPRCRRIDVYCCRHSIDAFYPEDHG